MEQATLYKNALKIVDKIYKNSQYNSDIDLFRITDIINSINDNQIASKQWLVDELYNACSNLSNPLIYVAGSWYGQITPLIKGKFPTSDVLLCDMDRESNNIGQQLLDGVCDGYTFLRENAIDDFIQRRKNVDILINTSCEHMEPSDVTDLILYKKPETIIVFQSNNYTEVLSHINCSESLDDFVDSLNLNEVLYKGVLNRNDYDRYMVIGQ